jgi:hypothetical protein
MWRAGYARGPDWLQRTMYLARRVQCVPCAVNSLTCIYSAMYSIINHYCLNCCLYSMSTVVTLNQVVLLVLYTHSHTHTHSPIRRSLFHPCFMSFSSFTVYRPGATALSLFFCIDFASKPADHSCFNGLRRA